MDGGKFDTNQEGVTEKIVKILCDKGMVDPFESLPMEVQVQRNGNEATICQ